MLMTDYRAERYYERLYRRWRWYALLGWLLAGFGWGLAGLIIRMLVVAARGA